MLVSLILTKDHLLIAKKPRPAPRPPPPSKHPPIPIPRHDHRLGPAEPPARARARPGFLGWGHGVPESPDICGGWDARARGIHAAGMILDRLAGSPRPLGSDGPCRVARLGYPGPTRMPQRSPCARKGGGGGMQIGCSGRVDVPGRQAGGPSSLARGGDSGPAGGALPLRLVGALITSSPPPPLSLIPLGPRRPPPGPQLQDAVPAPLRRGPQGLLRPAGPEPGDPCAAPLRPQREGRRLRGSGANERAGVMTREGERGRGPCAGSSRIYPCYEPPAPLPPSPRFLARQTRAGPGRENAESKERTAPLPPPPAPSCPQSPLPPSDVGQCPGLRTLDSAVPRALWGARALGRGSFGPS